MRLENTNSSTLFLFQTNFMEIIPVDEWQLNFIVDFCNFALARLHKKVEHRPVDDVRVSTQSTD